MKKWKNDRGELMVEVLAAILVATLSVALLFSCISASSQIDGGTEDLDEAHYNALTAADAPGPTASPVLDNITVTITGNGSSTSPTIEVFGGEGMYSYREK